MTCLWADQHGAMSMCADDLDLLVDEAGWVLPARNDSSGRLGLVGVILLGRDSGWTDRDAQAITTESV